ncbi:hypothetical protein [Lentzea sp. NBRC 102530]|uniref:hypothetical protein n=1 Tax=Lentzea sp. NBRC 102530 TaxID=3032201 RepID=UPI0024A2E3A3|nr:hypothetical protein [Lentzea sp. NBRC 102530]GLY55330.1 hypothetical protein Lesp01_89850 [Lentzea sp. NBRC 102530]
MGQKVELTKRVSFPMFTETATARTATGNGTALTLPDDVAELFVGIDITAVSGTTPTLVVQVQQQDANDVWQTLAATSSLNATGQATLHLPAGSFVLLGGGQARIRWVIGGTTPSFTFRVGIHGR